MRTPPTQDPHASLSARERQVIDAVYQLGEATADEVRARIPEPPSNATVRSTLRVLEEKGWLRHRRDAGRYVYRPVESRERIRDRLLGHVVHTFFDGSPSEVIAALVDRPGRMLSATERERIGDLLRAIREVESDR
jgi:predicted transcriptional regulator